MSTMELYMRPEVEAPEVIAQNPVALEVWEQQEELNLLYPPTERITTFRSIVDNTPLVTVGPGLVPEAAGYNILVKNDSLQPGGAYKIRGATNALMRAQEAQPEIQRAVVSSTGNHANTTAIAARKLGIPRVVAMCPRGTSPAKLAAMQENGAIVDCSFDTLLEAQAAAQQAGEAEGSVYIAPFDAIETIAGQGTAAQEVIQRLLHLHASSTFDLRRDEVVVFKPGGGGGYAAGGAVALAGLPNVSVVVSQMAGCEGIAARLQGRQLNPRTVNTSCDGAAVAVPGEKPMAILSDPHLVKEVRVVQKHEVGEAMRLLSQVHEPPEPAGALAFAAMLNYIRENPAPNDGRQRLLIPFTSGRNVTPAKLSEYAYAETEHRSRLYAERSLYGLEEVLARRPANTRAARHLGASCIASGRVLRKTA